jgi:WD40 repeat protein
MRFKRKELWLLAPPLGLLVSLSSFVYLQRSNLTVGDALYYRNQAPKLILRRQTEQGAPVTLWPVAFSPDNKYVVTGELGGAADLTVGLSLWDAHSGQRTPSFKPDIPQVRTLGFPVFSADASAIDVYYSRSSRQSRWERYDTRYGTLISHPPFHRRHELPGLLHDISTAIEPSKYQKFDFGEAAVRVVLYMKREPILISGIGLRLKREVATYYRVSLEAEYHPVAKVVPKKRFVIANFFDSRDSGGDISVKFSPDGRYLLVYLDNVGIYDGGVIQKDEQRIELFDMVSGHSLWSRGDISARLGAATFSSNGLLALYLILRVEGRTSKYLEIRALHTGAVLKAAPTVNTNSRIHIPQAMCFSPDNKTLAVPHADRVELWDVPSPAASAIE